jgi:hypothetical protein
VSSLAIHHRLSQCGRLSVRIPHATALNSFLETLNRVTEIERLTLIPSDAALYPRSKLRYTQLVKDAATCRNRGGEALAGVWGQLMVYGTVPGVSPCGMTLAEYFDIGS